MDDLLYCCRIRDDSGDFGAAAELLNALELDFSSWENREEKTLYHTIYATEEALGKANFERLRAAIPAWRELGLQLSDPVYFELRREEWADLWKQFFPVLAISPRLTVRPAWREYQPKPGEHVIEIDPGMSFGTGQHATTAFCLAMIDRCAGAPRMTSFLDAGCGSGILAIAALLLGFRHVEAFDYDPEAVRMANENFALNHISPETLTAITADAARFRGRPQGYDFVAANILAPVLKLCAPNIASWVRPGGTLALAGMLTSQYAPTINAFLPLGFTEIEQKTEKEWTCGLLQKAGEEREEK